MNPRNLSLTIGEARVAWLALNVFHNKSADADEVTIQRTLAKIEGLFSDEEWSLFYSRFHGKFLVGVDYGNMRDEEPTKVATAELAIAGMREAAQDCRNLPGLNDEAWEKAYTTIDLLTESDITYGVRVPIKYRTSNICIWAYPGITESDLTNPSSSATVET